MALPILIRAGAVLARGAGRFIAGVAEGLAGGVINIARFFAIRALRRDDLNVDLGMLNLRVTFDHRQVDAMFAALQRDLVPRVTAHALNLTAQQVQNAAARDLAFRLGREVGLRAKGFKKALGIIRASPGRLVATIVASGKAIPLVEFGARRTGAGVSAAPMGKRRVFRGAFISRMPSGHRGVFRRRTRERLPIREMWGPSVPGAFLSRDLVRLMQRTVDARLRPNFLRAWRAIVPRDWQGRGR